MSLFVNVMVENLMVMVRVDVDHPSILLSIDVGTMYSNISEKDESQTNQKTIFHFLFYY